MSKPLEQQITMIVQPDYGPSAMPYLILQRKGVGTIRVPISNSQRGRLKAWGIPVVYARAKNYRNTRVREDTNE